MIHVREKKPIALIHVREKNPIALIHVREKKHIALIHVREKAILMDVLRCTEIMSEEELQRPSVQADFKVDVNGQVQVQVLALQWLRKTAHL